MNPGFPVRPSIAEPKVSGFARPCEGRPFLQIPHFMFLYGTNYAAPLVHMRSGASQNVSKPVPNAKLFRPQSFHPRESFSAQSSNFPQHCARDIDGFVSKPAISFGFRWKPKTHLPFVKALPVLQQTPTANTGQTHEISSLAFRASTCSGSSSEKRSKPPACLFP